MKSKRWIPVVAAALAIAVGFGPTAAADDLVQFETTSTGTRTYVAVAPTFPVVTDLNVSQTIATTAPATSLVTELLATGSNPWSVKAQMCAPDNYASPTAGDCSVSGANRMVRADGDILQGSDIAVSHGAPVQTLGGGSTAAGSEANLGGQITLLNNTGQNPLTAYSGTYASTTNLTISNFTRVGVWKGMWVVTASF